MDCLHDKICVVFVDTVVAQVDARIIQTALISRVLDGRKTDQTVPVQIDDEGIVRSDRNVQSQIALVPVNEKRIGDVL